MLLRGLASIRKPKKVAKTAKEGENGVAAAAATDEAAAVAPSGDTTTTTQATSLLNLRPYQQHCIDTCLTKFESGIRRQAVSLPVAAGKTVIFSHLLSKIKDPLPGASKVLVLAHREELLQQAQKKIRDVNPHLVGLLRANS